MNTIIIFKNIINLIPTGPSDAIPKVDICKRLNITERELRFHIHQMRTSGIPILTSTDLNGYYLPSIDNGQQECLEFIRNQVNRAKACFRSTRGAQAYILRTSNQMSFINDQDGFDEFMSNNI